MDDEFNDPGAGELPENASPFGALDMAGSIWEWVDDPYAPYTVELGAAGNGVAEQAIARGGCDLAHDE